MTPKKRDWFDLATLAIAGAGFIAVVISTILTQLAQAGSDRDVSIALKKFSVIAASAKTQADALEKQVTAANEVASAATLQAASARDQIVALRHSLSVAQRAARYAGELVEISRKNFQSEFEFRTREMASNSPVISATDPKIIGISSGPNDQGEKQIEIYIPISNKGSSAVVILQYNIYFWISSPNRNDVEVAPQAGWGLSGVDYRMSPGETWKSDAHHFFHDKEENLKSFTLDGNPGRVFGRVKFMNQMKEVGIYCFDYDIYPIPGNNIAKDFISIRVYDDVCNNLDYDSLIAKNEAEAQAR